MAIPFVQAGLKAGFGGTLVLATGLLIGRA